MTLVDGLPSREAMTRVAREIPGHKQINLIYGGKSPLLSAPELYALGFEVVLYSVPAPVVAAQAMGTALKTLAQTHDLNSISEQSVSFPTFQERDEVLRQRGQTLSSFNFGFGGLNPDLELLFAQRVKATLDQADLCGSTPGNNTSSLLQ